jgi:hypothetical protein
MKLKLQEVVPFIIMLFYIQEVVPFIIMLFYIVFITIWK